MATAYESEYGSQQPYGPGSEPRRSAVPAALRAPFEARTWRELCYLVTSLPMAIVTFTFAVTMLSLGIGLLVTFLGVFVLGAALAGCRGLGVVERARARRLLRVDVADPEPLLDPRGRAAGRRGPLAWFGRLVKSGTSWRHVLYSLVHFPWAVFAFCMATVFWCNGWLMVTYPLWKWVFPAYTDQPGLQLFGDGDGGGRDFYLDTPFEVAATCAAGALVVLATPWMIRGLAAVDRVMVSGLLGPSRLATRVRELESDRGAVVDTAAADLRRIERDLHDGAQARLVALAMDLGLAREKLEEDPEAAARMVDEA
ncbi:sensor domain-containing protein, partial [Streptomyces sp. B1866]|uniref:sensor histidine kinase n=1 Tax=Streptomyces sp. B1866 TaxID=3075431 RepID=UPI00288EAE1C